MRNLRLIEQYTSHLDNDESEGSCKICIDMDVFTVFVVSYKGVYSWSNDDEEFEFRAFEGSLDGDVIAIQHVADKSCLVMATKNGDLLQYHLVTSELECMGSVTCGLQSMEWSHDKEMLILTTNEGKIILMSNEFDPINECAIEQDTFGASDFVNVGWGKKETQFHGSLGKEAAVTKQQELQKAIDWDDGIARITWRGDDQLFCVNNVHSQKGNRELRIYKRSGELHATGEFLSGLEQPLSWKPSGALIATTQETMGKHMVIFVEKNGLKHGEFVLPTLMGKLKIRELMWNSDSSALLVWAEVLETLQDKIAKTYLFIYTSSNYHWYLKQSLPFYTLLCDVIWDPLVAFKVHLVTSDRRYMRYSWSWETASSYGRSDQDDGLVAVVDGDRLLASPFRLMVVPPPLCAYWLQFESHILSATFSHDGRNCLIATTDNHLHHYAFTNTPESSSAIHPSVKFDAAGGGNFAKKCNAPNKIASFKYGDDQHQGLTISHVTWLNSSLHFHVTYDERKKKCMLHLCERTNDHVSVTCEVVCPGKVRSLQLAESGTYAVLQLADGEIHKVLWHSDVHNGTGDGVAKHSIQTEFWLKLPQPCVNIAVCTFNNEDVVLGLTDRNRLYANDVEIANDVTSFGIHNDFILMTTLGHACRSLSRDHNLADITSSKMHEDGLRRVERGSRIVRVIRDKTMVVLQMPRGNLEAIHPRTLVLSTIQRLLDRLEYREAFDLARVHRLNMNLLYDHNPSLFANNVNKFVADVNVVANINQFLTDLTPDDVTTTLYKMAYKVPSDKGITHRHKVDSICEAVKDAVTALDRNKYFHCVLTALVRKTTPEMGAALGLIREVRARDLKEADGALRYLCLLIDVNELYNIALGTYDFGLVVMVAEKSQKDPKEYIPFLKSLQAMDEHYQHYSIDVYLKRNKKALVSIFKCEDRFEEAMAFVKKHALYSDALTLCDAKSDHYKQISAAYGNHLLSKSRYSEAGLVFSRALLHTEALEAFKKDLEWQSCLREAMRLKLDSASVTSLARELAESLKNRERYSEAATLLHDYAKIHKHERHDFIESDLLSRLTDAADAQLRLIEQTAESWRSQVARFQQLVKEKADARLLDEEGVDRGDAYSDVTSVAGRSVISDSQRSRTSAHSRSSSRSSKNRRKAERRKWSLREGSAKEDLALLDALHKHVTLLERSKEEAKVLLQTLVRFNNLSLATRIQSELKALQKMVKSDLHLVWTRDVIVGDLAVGGEDEVSMPEQERLVRNPPLLKESSSWTLSMLDAT